jgi:hypothetical protein
MSINNKPYKLKNELEAVYETPNTFSKKISSFKKNNIFFKDFDSFNVFSRLKNEGFNGNSCIDSPSNPMDPSNCLIDISNNLTSILNQSQYQAYKDSEIKIDKNYTKLENDINLYNQANISTSEYDSIDDNGNLLYHNKEIDQTINDGLLEDGKDFLLQQNNLYLIGSFIATSVLILIVVAK